MKTKKKLGRPTNAEIAARKAAEEKEHIKKEENKVKEQNENKEFVFYSPDKRYVVAAVKKKPSEELLALLKNDVKAILCFGVAVTKRKDLWSPADKYNANLGRIKALGQAKSNNPVELYSVEAEDIESLQKVFNAKAESIGKRVVADIDKRLQKDEQKYLFGKSIQEALNFYAERNTSTMRANFRKLLR